MTDEQQYGKAPEVIAEDFRLDEWEEFMHYLYLPVLMPGHSQGLMLPPNLQFARRVIREVFAREKTTRWSYENYIYMTARKGYAAPGNPLNRPGWHADGFGTDDINYVWSDAYPTRFYETEEPIPDISEDHVESARQFDRLAEVTGAGEIKTYPDRTLLRLDPSVVHSVPEIPPPGGERSFLKISVSKNKFNLKGNSHNHLLDYDWKMYDRSAIRNDPAFAGGDSFDPDKKN